MGFVIRFAVLFIGGHQGHALANSLVTHLYSAEKDKQVEDDYIGLLADQEKDSKSIDGATRLNNAILNREKFTYGFW